MDEYAQKTVNVPLTIWELRDIRYYLYNNLRKEDVHTSFYINFLKNLFKKFNMAIEEFEPSNIGTVGQVLNENTLTWEGENATD